jgi:broad specificity phosphatase PhoE/CTP:molybdopterin cytidylyltransferase MocA
MSEISAIILAAGYSSRMGDFKPLLDIGGKPAVVVLLRSIIEAGVRNIIVVTGHNSDALEHALQSHLPNVLGSAIRTIHNARYADGMFTSIQTGIRATYCRETDGLLLFPVDVPLVPPHVIEDIISAWKASPRSFVAPCYRGKKGHPLLIPAQYAREILAHDGTDGLKAITDRYDDRLIRLETMEEAVVMDMNTQESYAELLRYRQHRTDTDEGRPRHDVHVHGKLILIRHGSTQRHREKIFLGQTDVPLSSKGRREAKAAGRELAAMNPHTDRIYTSDLSRASETAEIVAGILKRNPPMDIIPSPRLREIHLGDWDGRYIKEIKAAFPEEYEKRGEDILSYKRGTEAENHYDLSYRVNKELRRIFEDEAKRGISDIVVVAHAGTIRVIMAHLKHIPLADALRTDISKGSLRIIDF